MKSSKKNDNLSKALKTNLYSVRSPKALVIITHGIVEHSGRYTHVAEELNKHNFEVVTYDLRGHGCSPGPRAYIKNFSSFVSDLNHIVEKSVVSSPHLPVFLIGHSMGGLISYLHSIQEQTVCSKIKGYLLLSPALAVPPLNWIEKLKVFIGRIIKPLAPYKKENVGILSEELMTDIQFQQLHKNDDLVMKTATISLLIGLLNQSSQIVKQQKPSAVPTLLLQGDKDTIVDANGNIKFFQNLQKNGMTHLQYKVIANEKHELFNSEPEKRKEVFSMILQFMDQQLSE